MLLKLLCLICGLACLGCKDCWIAGLVLLWITFFETFKD